MLMELFDGDMARGENKDREAVGDEKGGSLPRTSVARELYHQYSLGSLIRYHSKRRVEAILK